MSDASRAAPPQRAAPPDPAAAPADRLGELLARVARRDRHAFARLYDATSAKLYGTVLRIIRERGLADDVVQEVYVTIWQKAAQFDAGRASPIAWMAAIARHAAIDERRRRPAPRHETEEALEHLPSEAPGARARAEQDQEARRLHACLAELDGGRRDMVRLAYLDGWSRHELATHFEQPVNTVKTWLHRALKQLKGCLVS